MSIVVSGAGTVVVEDGVTPSIFVDENAPSIVTTNYQPVISVSNDAYSITSDSGSCVIAPDSSNVVVLAAGSQGPQGIRGEQGLSGRSSLELVAEINLGGNRVITGSARYADNTDLGTIGRAIGVTSGAASTGLPVSVVVFGELDGFSGLAVNEPVYLSTNGTITQALPATGYLQKVGVAVSETKILIRINEPLAL